MLKTIQELLRSIKDQMGEGYTTGCGWDGQFLSFMIARPPGDIKPWVMTLDTDEDYEREVAPLLDHFVSGAKDWFGSQC